jgi:hypothetical protein
MKALFQAHPQLRRLAVALMYGAYCAGAAPQLQWAQHEIPRQPQATIILVLFALSFAAGALLFVGAHYWRWGNAKTATLDEREIATRNRVYASAYRWVALISMVGCVAWQSGWRPLHPLSVDSNVIVWGYVLLLATLPAALLAWTEPPAPDLNGEEAPA